ncbi:MAG: hypothetical protein ACXWCG_03305 [Flavitalea sp.]
MEIHLKVSRKKLFARETGENFQIALHGVVDHLESQLRWNKTEEEGLHDLKNIYRIAYATNTSSV